MVLRKKLKSTEFSSSRLWFIPPGHVPAAGQGTHQQDALPGHPADGEHCSALDPVVVPTVQVSAHAKISYLDSVVLPH